MLDNASNNDTFARALEEDQEVDDEFFGFVSSERRLRCFAHVVHLAVKAALAEPSFVGLLNQVSGSGLCLIILFSSLVNRFFWLNNRKLIN